jgi:hypothetical protein
LVDRFGVFRSFRRDNDLSSEKLLTIKEKFMSRATSTFGYTASTLSAFNMSQMVADKYEGFFLPALPCSLSKLVFIWADKRCLSE